MILKLCFQRPTEIPIYNWTIIKEKTTENCINIQNLKCLTTEDGLEQIGKTFIVNRIHFQKLHQKSYKIVLNKKWRRKKMG